jgi:hypothetical protein
LDKDPAERRDVFTRFRDDPDVRDLQKRLIRRTREILNSKKDIELDQDSRDMLRSLGYIRAPD